MAIDPFQSTYNPTMVAGGQQPYGYSAYNPNLQGAYSATLSPQEVAQLSAGDRLGLEIGRKKKQVQDIAKKIPGQTQQAYADILPGLAAAGVNTRNIGRLGSAGVTGLSAYQQFAANEPTGAIASIAGGLGAGKLASMGARVLTAGMPGIGGKIIRAAAPILGSVLGTQLGPAAEGIKNAVTGQQTGNKPETKGTETPLFGPNNIPLNEAARRYAYETQLMDREFGYSKQMLGSEVAAQKDLIQHQFQQQLQYSKSLDPLVQSGLDKHLVRSQALLNTQGNIDARLGILATQGALAKGAQAEAGALARTMASTNPYIQAAVRQSPNIQFG
jgi:hypothetical protein